MPLSGWPDCPEAVRDQVSGLVESLQLLLGNALVGIYLHGSLAYGCFNPRRSDIDLLIVTARPLLPDTTRGPIQFSLRRSAQLASLEHSAAMRPNPFSVTPSTPVQVA